MLTVKTHYAKSGNVHIAYQVMGSGPLDIVYVQGAFSHLDVMMENPSFRRFCERLASFSRLIRFDKRGMGLSDHVPVATLEERMDDVRAVMDAAGSERAALLGSSEGGPLSILFAASYPHRTTALLLCGAEIKELKTPDWPWGESTWEEFDESMKSLAERWGEGAGLSVYAPSVGDDPRLKEWLGRVQMQSASPGAAEAFMRMALEIDVRDVVPTLHVPTLILHREGDRVCHVNNGRYLAEHIRGATYIELAGEDHLPYVDGDEIVAEIQEFLTGVREMPEPDRVLATVMFTDIVQSTERAAEAGDRRWGELLTAHHAVVRRQLERFRGREIDNAGDGFLSVFDGPARAIRCALSTVETASRELGIDIRAGVHTGECELVDGKLGGIAVHIGARVASQAECGEVLVSGTVKDLVAGAGIEFVDCGPHQLKGIPGEWRLFKVVH